MTGEQELPWKRLTAEVVAIVGSILLAFSIDAWWDERQERKEEQELLRSLQVELQHNIGRIESALEFENALLEPTRELLEGAISERVNSVSELEQLLGRIYWVNTTELATGIFQSLLQGGRLTLIKQTELRGRIASLMTDYEEIVEIESWHGTAFEDQFMPYLKNKIDLGRLINEKPPKPTETESRYPRLPEIGIETRVDMLRDPDFHNILLLQISNHYDAMYSLNKARVTLEKLIVDIDEYLGPP